MGKTETMAPADEPAAPAAADPAAAASEALDAWFEQYVVPLTESNQAAAYPVAFHYGALKAALAAL